MQLTVYLPPTCVNLLQLASAMEYKSLQELTWVGVDGQVYQLKFYQLKLTKEYKKRESEF